MRINLHILLCCLMGGFTSQAPAFSTVGFDRSSLNINGVTYSLEIASTQAQRRHGLMYRSFLEDRKGMVFIYPQVGDHYIWMKNTRIPLTVVWVDANAVVIGIKNLRPCITDPCPSYGVRQASKYIIELNSGKHGVQVGDRIEGLTRLEKLMGQK